MEEVIKLKDLLDEINDNKLILPDFQRDYVWIKEDDKIENFIASVLSQLPIGSIIKFEDYCTSFANKEIAFNKSIEFSNNNQKVEYLLDGQQRITTLSLVFSDRIFSKILTENNGYSSDDLIQKNKITKRYFIQIPMSDDDKTIDFFGYNKLFFPFPDPDKVTFCSSGILDIIRTESFSFATKDEKKDEWYYPRLIEASDKKFQNRIIKEASSKGLIHLYLLTDHEDIVTTILSEMAESKSRELQRLFPINNVNGIIEYISKNQNIYNINLEQNPEEIIENFTSTNIILKQSWISKMKDYLSSCVKNLRINVFEVKNENTERAINMYEALNKGGAKLSTYDLIIARAASKSSKYGSLSYAENNKRILKEYCNDEILKIVSRNYKIDKWDSCSFVKTMKNDEIAPLVINQFLNLLCFVANHAEDDKTIKPRPFENLSTDFCKAKEQLKLSTDQILKFSEISLNCIIDTLMILQFKCGVYNVSKLDYNIMILPLAYMIYLYESKSVAEDRLEEIINKIVGFYNYALFTGQYQSDQSAVVMKHLELVNNWIMMDETPKAFIRENQLEYIDSKVLQITSYNDKDTLLYKGDIAPKNAVRNSILQFVLSQNPCDVINDSGYGQLNAWNPDIKFEAHHMVPLASQATIKQSATEIRRKDDVINSPLNMILIPEKTNRTISSFQISEYYEKLNSSFNGDYGVQSNISRIHFKMNDENSKKQLEDILETRYKKIKGDIVKSIKRCIE